MEQQRGSWWLGVDVSKSMLDCARSDRDTTWRVPNTPEGWASLTDRLADDPPMGIVMEATGVLHLHLSSHDWHSSVINPSWTANYARSQGRLGQDRSG